MPSTPTDVTVIGGGPAGSTAARLLAEWGHSVTLIAKQDGRPNLAESLPPSVVKLLEHVGALDAVNAGGFYRTTGNTVWWGDPEGRSENFLGGAEGYQIESARLEDLLLELARHAGVRLIRGVVREVTFGEDSAEVAYETQGEQDLERCTWVLDCSGRAGVIAKQGLRQPVAGRRTLALVRVWTSAKSWDLPDPSHTLVESYQDGWAWSIPVSPTERHTTVMVDPTLTDLTRGADISRMYDAELAKAPRIHQVGLGGSPVGEPFACNASQYTASEVTGDGFLLVGDAVSGIDPLSSFGVKKALVSGWMAAVVTNTCLRNEAMRRPALELYDRREREAYSSLLALAERFYRDAADTHDHPYWLVRGEASAAEAVDAISPVDVQHLKSQPEVVAAFEALKAAPGIELRASAAMSFASGPAVQGREVVLEEQIVSPWTPHGIRYLRDVDLPALARMAQDFGQVPELYDAYNSRHAPVVLPDFLGALAVLLGKGILVNELSD